MNEINSKTQVTMTVEQLAMVMAGAVLSSKGCSDKFMWRLVKDNYEQYLPDAMKFAETQQLIWGQGDD